MKVTFNLILIAFSLLFFIKCNTTETPPLQGNYKITIETITQSHRSITIKVKSESDKAASIEIFRQLNGTDTLVAEYTTQTNDTTIVDDNNGKGLKTNTTYKYYGKVISNGNSVYSSDPVEIKTEGFTSHDVSWNKYELGDAGFSNNFRDVWVYDENNVYIAGGLRINDTAYGVVKWDGNNFIPSKKFGDERAIIGFGKDDIWVVGATFEHFDGNKWNWIDAKEDGNTVIPLDSILYYNQPYGCIWGTDSKNLYMGSIKGKIVHWDGEKAEVIADFGNYNITDIKGINPDLLLAVGYNINPGLSVVTYIERGTLNPVSVFSNGYFWPNAIKIFNEKEKYIAGYGIAVGDQTSWRIYSVPNFDGYNYLNGINGLASNNIFVCGAKGNVLHFNGKEWHQYQDFYSTGRGLVGIGITKSKVYIVGSDYIDPINGKAILIIGETK